MTAKAMALGKGFPTAYPTNTDAEQIRTIPGSSGYPQALNGRGVSGSLRRKRKNDTITIIDIETEKN